MNVTRLLVATGLLALVLGGCSQGNSSHDGHDHSADAEHGHDHGPGDGHDHPEHDGEDQ